MPTCSRWPARRGLSAIQAFFIRGGQNWGHRAFFPAHTNDVPEAEVLSSFLVAVLRRHAAAAGGSCVDRELARSRSCSKRRCPSAPSARSSIEIPQRGARPKAARAGEAQCRGSARPPARRDRRRRARSCASLAEAFGLEEPAGADRGLRQQPHHGDERGRRHDRGRPRRLPEEPVHKLQHQEHRDHPGRRLGDDEGGASAAGWPAW